MCGIAGYLLRKAEVRSVAPLLRMCKAMAHRGPDDEGFAFIDRHGKHALLGTSLAFSTLHPDKTIVVQDRQIEYDLALGHRRFSIIDLSVAAHQPFWSEDGRIGLTFNGEIYNYEYIRDKLLSLGHAFHTASDTEVLLKAYREWGIEAFSYLRGFWAIAIYDADTHTVLLCRDPLGKAPLYYAPMANGIAWASEIKALRPVALPGAFQPREQAIHDFVQYGYRDVDNLTCYSGIRTLPAGTYTWLDTNCAIQPHAYWRLPVERRTEGEISPDEAIKTFREKFIVAVERRLRADVPVACELSGGMDSSSIVAAAVSLGRSVNTFTVKFDEVHSDEEPFARHLHDRYPNLIDYHVIRPEHNDFWEAADDYVALMDEPFHLPNLYTNFTVWKTMAKSGIRVSLNGAGGDELLAGYRSDYAAQLIHYLFRHGQLTAALRELLKARERPGHRILAAHYRRLLTQRFGHFDDGQILRTPSATEPCGPHQDLLGRLQDLMGNWRMNYWLRSAHQSWMGVPMEVRAPFLDVDLCDFVFSLPPTYLIRDGWHKWILRKAMADILPAEIAWRRLKMGFPFPIKEWLVASKAHYFRVTAQYDCPFIDAAAMKNSYDRMIEVNPHYLWRAMSVTLWWIRSIMEATISA